MAAVTDRAVASIKSLFNSAHPVVTEKAAKIETKKAVQNTKSVSIDVYFTFTGKGAIVVKLLNAKKEAVATIVPSVAAAAATGVEITLRVPPSYYYEPEFAEGTASEATHVTGA